MLVITFYGDFWEEPEYHSYVHDVVVIAVVSFVDKSFRKFSFCQYPFILSLGAKRYVMQKDSESQMIVMARVMYHNMIEWIG